MARVPDPNAPSIAVIGGATATLEAARLAFDVGGEIARRGGIVLCGGRGGVMEQAAKGAHEAGGVSIGILPGQRQDRATNPWLTYEIFTGLGQARNQVIVLSAAAVIAVAGEWGTLSEIGLALKYRVPVILLESFELNLPDGGRDPLLLRARTGVEAVTLALEHRLSPE